MVTVGGGRGAPAESMANSVGHTLPTGLHGVGQCGRTVLQTEVFGSV